MGAAVNGLVAQRPISIVLWGRAARRFWGKIGRGADLATTAGNLVRLGVLVLGTALAYLLPHHLVHSMPDLAGSYYQLAKVGERVTIWHEPWRMAVGEQILQNRWALAGYSGTFQWFSNLHSDFVLTAVARVLSPAWAGVVVLLTLYTPLAAMALAGLRWTPVFRDDPLHEAARKRSATVRCLIILFCGLYLFIQNFVHIGSVLGLIPMTGVTLSWISSGGTNTVVCYLVLSMLYVALREDGGWVSARTRGGRR